MIMKVQIKIRLVRVDGSRKVFDEYIAIRFMVYALGKAGEFNAVLQPTESVNYEFALFWHPWSPLCISRCTIKGVDYCYIAMLTDSL